MPKHKKARPEQPEKPKTKDKKKRKKKHRRQKLFESLDLRRFFMPNIDKIVKALFNQMDESREVMRAAVRNQELLIQQNQMIVESLEKIYAAMVEIKAK
ncbi:hypothetical protein [Dendrosporobacter sp. 1207_IL3150]|uniref:hypothetical protein n=1 Tax=Dendrosporobacter sp. 1207_IL3150 TaxID=3084054 RepID=UPI002FDA56EA